MKRMVWKRISDRLFKGEHLEPAADKGVVKTFRKRYARFRKLLDANAALADLLADVEGKLQGKSLFGMNYVRAISGRAVDLTRRMAKNLNEMSDGRRRGLERAVDRIAAEIDGALSADDAPRGAECKNLVLSLDAVNLELVDWVGGKSANLGEMRNMAGVPVPRGFAVTIAAFQRFMEYEDLGTKVESLLSAQNPDDREGLSALLEDVRRLVESAPLPPDLEQAFASALHSNFGDDDARLAVRSSAQSEDGSKSFAGQFLTELGVPRDGVTASYRRVVASLFTPSATLYRLHQGIPLSASGMAVACLEMVDATASGVAYSHDPVNLLQNTLLINGVYGLGRYAVDGLVEPDLWVFTRENPPELARRRTGFKDRMLVLNSAGEPEDRTVPEEARRLFCLSETEAAELAALVMRLEKHYGGYQDVEWAKTKDGRLIFLQSRPLDTRAGRGRTPKPPLLHDRTLLIEGGDIAYPGVGQGRVVMPDSLHNLAQVPNGSVLVAAHSSAEYAAVIDRVQAVLTQTGGITGHMATICREFRVPTLLNVPGLMKTLRPGQEVTVDAFSARVYEGLAEELKPLRLVLDPVRLVDTPVHGILRDVAKFITPLNLIDPASPKFNADGCRTLHDVMRLCHELSYHEMFAISDTATDAGGVAMKLKAALPIDLHIIDLDRGTDTPPGARSVTPEQILSAPLKALLSGMLRPDVMFRRPRPVNMGGFMSVMGRQMLNGQGDQRFGDKSYAIVSDRYMNFSSRVGYHYSVLDAYCGQTLSKNYIAFSFQGGAAGEARRERRIRAISLVLRELGFTVTVQGDALKSRFAKYPKEDIAERLDQLGRLLQVTRQLDMLMVNEQAVTQFRDDFMSGIYR